MDVQSKLSNASATINILFLVQAGDSFHFYYVLLTHTMFMPVTIVSNCILPQE